MYVLANNRSLTTMKSLIVTLAYTRRHNIVH